MTFTFGSNAVDIQDVCDFFDDHRYDIASASLSFAWTLLLGYMAYCRTRDAARPVAKG